MNSFEETEGPGPMLEKTVARLSTIRLILLTMGFAGLQFVFSLIFSNGSAFLRNLGLDSWVISLVWLGGPLCGAILQPYFGLCSEQCRSPWGRRRPYIVGGAASAVISVLILAYIDAATATSAAGTAPAWARFGAILGTTALNVAIQPLQGGLRALLVDVSPQHQLATANAWAGSLISVASLLGYLVGFLDLNGPFSPPGSSQFHVLCLSSVIALVISVTLTCVSVRETPNTEPDTGAQTGLVMIKEVVSRLICLCKSLRRLPRNVQLVCYIQFFAWLAWAPFLFYISLYVGDIYQFQVLEINRQQAPNTLVVQDATRMGSLALLLFSTTALLTGLLLPLMILRKSEKEAMHNEFENMSTKSIQSRSDARIQRVWMWSHVLYVLCILSTFLVTSLWGTYVLVGLCGISWAVTIWAPFSLISTAIRHDEKENEDEEKYDACVGDERTECRPGIVMALHNTAISAPQIVALVISMIVFYICGGSNDVGSPNNGVLWTLRITSLSAIISALIAKIGFQ